MENLYEEIRTEFDNFKFNPISRFEQIHYGLMYKPQIKDKVLLVNLKKREQNLGLISSSKKKEQNVGVISSFCRDRIAQIYVGEGTFLHCAIKNLILLDRDEFKAMRLPEYESD